jgi:hypothetical protein
MDADGRTLDGSDWTGRWPLAAGRWPLADVDVDVDGVDIKRGVTCGALNIERARFAGVLDEGGSAVECSPRSGSSVPSKDSCASCGGVGRASVVRRHRSAPDIARDVVSNQ